MRRLWIILLLLCLVVACGAEATPTPDLVATQIAVEEAAHATMTARALAPTYTALPVPTETSVPPTAPPTLAPTSTDAPTIPPTLTNTPTQVVPPTDTAAPALTATPKPPTPTKRPPTATPIVYRPEPYTAVNVAPDDVLNVRAGPGVSNPVVGSMPPHAPNVQVGEMGQKVGGALWLPVWYRGTEGWANGNYLARQVGWVPDGVGARAARIIWAIKQEDMGELAALIHPDQGVRFSPYTYVRVDEDLVFAADQLTELWGDATVYTWGAFDGSGEPIEFTFQQYYGRFVYDVDFVRPDVVGFDVFIGTGNMINNIRDVYPGAIIVEYHFEGFDPQYGGMDWRSLRLVLEEFEGQWYLIGIVHDEWTI